MGIDFISIDPFFVVEKRVMKESRDSIADVWGERTPQEYEAHDPKGRAILKAADYAPPEEQPDETYPFWLTTGRVVYHWHTRTKTARALRHVCGSPHRSHHRHAGFQGTARRRVACSLYAFGRTEQAAASLAHDADRAQSVAHAGRAAVMWSV
jgi:hypothetical protein